MLLKVSPLVSVEPGEMIRQRWTNCGILKEIGGCRLLSSPAKQGGDGLGIASCRQALNPTVGLWEDAATGSAAGPLCAYLGHTGKLGVKGNLTIEQGTQMGRQSFLAVELQPAAQLSGTGVVVLRGQLEL